MKKILLIALFLLLVSYSLFQARALILGPQVSIETPRDGETVREPLLTLSGKSRNAAWLELNGAQIFTDENGYWEEKLLVSSGLSIMTIKVRDRFGRVDTDEVRIILN